jgi:hypothetical protein
MTGSGRSVERRIAIQRFRRHFSDIRFGFAEVRRAITSPAQHLRARVAVRIGEFRAQDVAVFACVIHEQIGLAVTRGREAVVAGTVLPICLTGFENRLERFLPRSGIKQIRIRGRRSASPMQ